MHGSKSIQCVCVYPVDMPSRSARTDRSWGQLLAMRGRILPGLGEVRERPAGGRNDAGDMIQPSDMVAFVWHRSLVLVGRGHLVAHTTHTSHAQCHVAQGLTCVASPNAAAARASPRRATADAALHRCRRSPLCSAAETCRPSHSDPGVLALRGDRDPVAGSSQCERRRADTASSRRRGKGAGGADARRASGCAAAGTPSPPRGRGSALAAASPRDARVVGRWSTWPTGRRAPIRAALRRTSRSSRWAPLVRRGTRRMLRRWPSGHRPVGKARAKSAPVCHRICGPNPPAPPVPRVPLARPSVRTHSPTSSTTLGIAATVNNSTERMNRKRANTTFRRSSTRMRPRSSRRRCEPGHLGL